MHNTNQNRVRQRVVYLVKTWIQHHPEDFNSEKALYERLCFFITDILPQYEDSSAAAALAVLAQQYVNHLNKPNFSSAMLNGQ